MKNLKYTFVLFIFSFFSSISLMSQNSVFETGIQNPAKLPPLTIYIEPDDLAAAYLDREMITAKEYEGEELSGRMQSSFFYEDKKVLDTKNLFEHYLKNDLLNNGISSGEVRMNVKYYDYDYHPSTFSFLNVLTFGVTTLLGVPGFRGKTVVEIEMEIYDNDFNTVAYYTATGKNKHFSGLYYRKVDERQSNLLALKAAIRSVNQKLMMDYELINNGLGIEPAD